MYKEKLIEENVINTEKVESIIKAHTELLANELSSWESYEPEVIAFLNKLFLKNNEINQNRPVTSNRNGLDLNKLPAQLHHGILE